MTHINTSYDGAKVVSGLIEHGIDFQELAKTGNATLENIQQSGEGPVRFDVLVHTLWVSREAAVKILGDALS